ncbi:hypothetical protein BB559_000066 [Furculomyces boomerangus]|uniref:Extracellular membrane protein CFEM domain-containing protein n=1 Tax=Furculomyces boomerangus TaxID=61424 RepID=A0A2T9Z6D9_9FUNG|nr:hypothetical protein BB559_000066 [Furculomyces boomerangus]
MKYNRCWFGLRALIFGMLISIEKGNSSQRFGFVRGEISSEECYKSKCNNDPSNVGCIAICFGVQKPNEKLIDGVDSCFVGCKPISSKIFEYANCINRCISEYYRLINLLPTNGNQSNITNNQDIHQDFKNQSIKEGEINWAPVKETVDTSPAMTTTAKQNAVIESVNFIGERTRTFDSIGRETEIVKFIDEKTKTIDISGVKTESVSFIAEKTTSTKSIDDKTTSISFVNERTPKSFDFIGVKTESINIPGDMVKTNSVQVKTDGSTVESKSVNFVDGKTDTDTMFVGTEKLGVNSNVISFVKSVGALESSVFGIPTSSNIISKISRSVPTSASLKNTMNGNVPTSVSWMSILGSSEKVTSTSGNSGNEDRSAGIGMINDMFKEGMKEGANRTASTWKTATSGKKTDMWSKEEGQREGESGSSWSESGERSKTDGSSSDTDNSGEETASSSFETSLGNIYGGKHVFSLVILMLIFF